jgi:hypothetical protein
MGIHVKWYEHDDTVIYWEFDAEWSWDDYHQAVIRGFDLDATKPEQRLDIIFDFTRNRQIPRGIRENITKGQSFEDAERDYRVVIVGNHLVRAMVELARTFNPTFGIKYLTASTVAEAYRMIVAARQAVPVTA